MRTDRNNAVHRTITSKRPRSSIPSSNSSSVLKLTSLYSKKRLMTGSINVISAKLNKMQDELKGVNIEIEEIKKQLQEENNDSNKTVIPIKSKGKDIKIVELEY